MTGGNINPGSTSQSEPIHYCETFGRAGREAQTACGRTEQPKPASSDWRYVTCDACWEAAHGPNCDTLTDRAFPCNCDTTIVMRGRGWGKTRALKARGEIAEGAMVKVNRDGSVSQTGPRVPVIDADATPKD